MSKLKLVPFLLFFLSIFCCEKEIIAEESSSQENEELVSIRLSSSIVEKEAMPEIINILDTHLKSKSTFMRTSEAKGYTIYRNKAIKVNRGQNTNYTFDLYINGQTRQEFYNIIINKNSKGTEKKPYVRHYTVNADAIDAFIESDYDFRYFKGRFEDIDLNTFLANLNSDDQNLTRGTFGNCDDEGYVGGGGDFNVDLIDDDGDVYWENQRQYGFTRTYGTWNNYGGSGGYDLDVQVHSVPAGTNERASNRSVYSGSISINTSGGIYQPSVQSNTDYASVTTYVPSSGSSNVCSTTLAFNIGGIYSTYTYYYECAKPVQLRSQATDGDCPDGGDVGVSVPRSIMILLNKLEVEPDTAEEACIKSLDPAFATDAVYYLNSGSGTLEEKEQFAWLGILEMCSGSGGEVDFENELIYTEAFKNTKAYCVLQELINSGNNIFKKVSEAFTQNNSKFKLRFDSHFNPNDSADARTGLPDSNGIITIKFNSALSETSSSISLAGTILHETIHAELHRIKLSNNAPPNSIPTLQYNWFIDMWEEYERLYDDPNKVASNSEHYFMANYYINNIATGLREFDSFAHNLESYKFFAWDGLKKLGKQAGYITQNELDALAVMSTQINLDNHENPCD